MEKKLVLGSASVGDKLDMARGRDSLKGGRGPWKPEVGPRRIRIRLLQKDRGL